MISEFYPEIELTFSPKQHRYRARVDGGASQNVPGVTTIIGQMNKPALMPWVAKMCSEWLADNWLSFTAEGADIDGLIKDMKGHYRDTTDKAADTGTIAHQWIERWIGGAKEDPPENPESAAAVRAFFEWWHGHNINVIASERVLFSKANWYAGTVDLICEVDGDLTIVDFKTSKAIYDDMGLQLAAYQNAWTEMTGENRPIKRLIVNITKEGKLNLREFDKPNDMEAFLACLTLYRWNQSQPKRKY